MGACSEKGAKTVCGVQLEPGTVGDDRELFNPTEGSDQGTGMSQNPTNYVVELTDQSKAGLLNNASQSHFEKYSNRLGEITFHISETQKVQQELLNRLSEICSQEPVKILGGFDPDEEAKKYIANRPKDVAASSEESGEEAGQEQK
jgi:hypothetical protein